jgi:hypothetical protein
MFRASDNVDRRKAETGRVGEEKRRRKKIRTTSWSPKS